jgi:hypothetical protein
MLLGLRSVDSWRRCDPATWRARAVACVNVAYLCLVCSARMWDPTCSEGSAFFAIKMSDYERAIALFATRSSDYELISNPNSARSTCSSSSSIAGASRCVRKSVVLCVHLPKCCARKPACAYAWADLRTESRTEKYKFQYRCVRTWELQEER